MFHELLQVRNAVVFMEPIGMVLQDVKQNADDGDGVFCFEGPNIPRVACNTCSDTCKV